MNPPKVAEVVVSLPVQSVFDYAVSDGLQSRVAVGKRVKIVFNRRTAVGVIVKLKQKSLFPRLNAIVDVLDPFPSVNEKFLSLSERLSEYYGCSQGEAIFSFLPNALRKTKKVDVSLEGPKEESVLPINTARSFLVHDPTLKNYWPFILDKAKEVLASGKSVIILMPSLEAIGSVKDRVKETLNVPVFLLDKKLTPKKELEIWFEIQQGIPCVALGTLSAVFAPMPQLGSIVICEEENTVYKQEQSPFFRVHHIAQCRCEIENAMLVLTSAAPSVETYKQAQDKQWEIVSFFPKEYSGFQLIDMSNYKSQRATFLSFPLQNMIYRSLEENKKIVLVMNRKGFTTTTRCSCGHTMRCQRCDVNMIYMYAKQKLVCRHCGKEEELPKMCPACKTSYLHSSGGGIEKLESEVARFYPQARVARYDRDTPRFPKDAQIIISTQAITKMQDQMIFDIVALLDFDAQLNRFDFRCANKVFSLLVVLRQMAKEKLLVQTSMRDSYLLKYLDAMDFKGFYKKELSLRKELGFPPSQHLLSIVVRGEKEEIAFQQVKELCDILQAQDIKKVEISDPHPDIVPKLRDKYRFTIVLKSRSAKENLTLARKALSAFKKRKGVVVTINVDP